MKEASQNHGAIDVGVGGEESEPWFFGQLGEELFGWLSGRAAGPSKRPGVVLCGTLGAESLSTHRALRMLANSLAEYKIPTLRFDYAGTGDSVDPQGAALRLSTCVDNVRTAIQVVKAQTSVDRVVVVGVRLGALFAVKAAELEEVSGLVLWGPVVTGKRFVREWNVFADRSQLPDGPAGEEMVHAAGFSLERKFLDELACCSVLQAEPLGSPACLVVEREELAPEDKLVDRLKQLGLKTDRCRPGGFLAGMIRDPHLTEVPVRAIQEIREWIADTDRVVSDSTLTRSQGSIRPTKTVLLPINYAGSIRIRERFLNLDETDGVFGVVSEPVDPADWNGQCVVLLNAGSVHHIGPNRMYVEFSRRMAAQGSRVCRADLSGLGDSRVRTASRENDPYPAGAVDDVGRIVRALRSSGDCRRVALVGLCSGAWASFHGGLALDGITDVVLINPDFYGERSVVGKPASFVRPKDYSHYKHSARSWAKWKKLLMGRANVTKIIRVLWNQATLRFASFKARIAGDHHRLDDDLARLAISGVRVGFIFSPGDGGVDFLKSNGRVGLERLRRSGLLREVTVSDSDHPFSLPGSQKRLGDVLSEWLRLDAVTSSQGIVAATQDSKRFAFGKNWLRFLKIINDERIAEAEKSLRTMLGMDSFAGLTFLDVGSGSGLFSLAARRLGARVLSFDYDPDSVACTRALQEKYCPGDQPTSWQIEQGSALDGDYLSALGTFDIVYAWGVLHHTGDMWKALERTISRVKPDGLLYISIYNDEGWRSSRNMKIKQFYVHLPDGLKPFMAGVYIAWEVTRTLAADILRLRNPMRRYREKIKSRGMSSLHDMIDWLGGYPFEVAQREAIIEFGKRHGLQLEKLKTPRTGHGCNEYVFCNSSQSAQAHVTAR